MSEDDLLKAVLDLAHLYSWRAAHFRPAMTARGYRTAVQGDGKGFVDLVLAKVGRTLFVELKSERGELSDAQMAWVNVLNAAVWTPVDWRSGRILATLKGDSRVP